MLCLKIRAMDEDQGFGCMCGFLYILFLIFNLAINIEVGSNSFLLLRIKCVFLFQFECRYISGYQWPNTWS